MPLYQTYGLTIDSEIPLPELVSGDGEADVVIRYGKLDRPSDTPTDQICLYADAEEVYLHWEDIGILYIRQGCEIIIDPIPDVTEDTLHLFILGSGLAVLLHQRQHLVLHASAVAVNNEVVAFIGDKGWGKSTTAAILHQRGHQLLTDDLVAIFNDDNGCPQVLAGYPQFKLWPESVEALGHSVEELPRIRPELDKRAHRIETNFQMKPLPLRRIYVLGFGDHLEIVPLPAPIAFMQITRHIYVSRYGTAFLQATGQDRIFTQCKDLLQHIPVRVIRRKQDLSALSDIAELIENDLKQPQA